MKANIKGFLDVSTVDYPGHVSSVVWFCGCPFRCPFCYNADVARADGCFGVETQELISKIRSTLLLNDAVTITGGEPTLQIEALVEVLKAAKKMGLKTQINTNGFFPENLKRALPYLDLVAIDVKTRLDPSSYGKLIGGAQDGHKAIENLKKSLELLKGSDCTVQIRTTVIPGMNDDPKIISEISEQVSWADYYVLRKFRRWSCMDESFKDIEEPDDLLMESLKKVAEKKIKVFVK